MPTEDEVRNASKQFASLPSGGTVELVDRLVGALSGPQPEPAQARR